MGTEDIFFFLKAHQFQWTVKTFKKNKGITLEIQMQFFSISMLIYC